MRAGKVLRVGTTRAPLKKVYAPTRRQDASTPSLAGQRRPRIIEGYGTGCPLDRVPSHIEFARPFWGWAALRPDARRAARFPAPRETARLRRARRRECEADPDFPRRSAYWRAGPVPPPWRRPAATPPDWWPGATPDISRPLHRPVPVGALSVNGRSLRFFFLFAEAQ